MKSEKGITLTALVVYIAVATLVISTITIVSSFFVSNMNLIKDQKEYAPEINYFNMYFIEDIKSNRAATTTDDKKEITFEDGTVYKYNQQNRAIYRNDTKIAEKVNLITFTISEIKVSNTTKQIVTVNFSFGDKKTFRKEIEYVLKYW